MKKAPIRKALTHIVMIQPLEIHSSLQKNKHKNSKYVRGLEEIARQISNALLSFHSSLPLSHLHIFPDLITDFLTI